MNGLIEKGHDCFVLTSTYKAENCQAEAKVYRLLELEANIDEQKSFTIKQRNDIRKNNEVNLLKTISAVKPDLLFIWNMGALGKSLLLLAEDSGITTLYFLSDPWVIYKYRINKYNLIKWLQDFRNIFRRPKLHNVICSCKYLQDELVRNGVPVENGLVIYNSIDLEPYLSAKRNEPVDRTKILYVGQLEEHKGVHTLVEAFSRLAKERRDKPITLSLVGSGNQVYMERLYKIVSDAGINEIVDFVGKVPRESLVDFFSTHSVFVFPSIWEEPFSLTLIMALASGIPIISTLTGGSKEILNPQGNCLSFQAGDVTDLADKMARLIVNHNLQNALGGRGRMDSRKYNLPTMIDKIDSLLTALNTQN